MHFRRIESDLREQLVIPCWRWVIPYRSENDEVDQNLIPLFNDTRDYCRFRDFQSEKTGNCFRDSERETDKKSLWPPKRRDTHGFPKKTRLHIQSRVELEQHKNEAKKRYKLSTHTLDSQKSCSSLISSEVFTPSVPFNTLIRVRRDFSFFRSDCSVVFGPVLRKCFEETSVL